MRGNETRTPDTAATGGPAAENRPAERSHGESAVALLREIIPVVIFARREFSLAAGKYHCTGAEVRELRDMHVKLGLWLDRARTLILDGCESGAASPEIGSLPNTAAETDGTNTGGKTQ